MASKIVQICDINKCDKKPVTIEVGNVTHLFCCQKGFEQSVKDFAKTIKPIKQ